MTLKACTVVVHDLNETAHSIDVTAETLYEAIAQALATLRVYAWVGDIALGDLMVEAKLTETGFQTTSARMIERYRDLEEVFDSGELMRSGEAVQCYQLVRGVLAAHATGGSFCVFCDARRPDLIENWYSVMRAVRSCVLRCRLRLLTWQEMTASLPGPLQKFLAAKYGIAS